MPNTSGDIFPVGLLAQDASGVIQVWNGSAWVTYTGSAPTNVPRPNPGPLPYPASGGAGATLVSQVGGGGGVSYSLPSVASVPGPYTVIKTDSGAGAVTVNTPDGALINGASSYVLVNQYQSATFQLLGGAWYVVSNN